MKASNYFSLIVTSFYDKASYQQVGRQGRGVGFWYLCLVHLIIMLLFVLSSICVPNFSDLRDHLPLPGMGYHHGMPGHAMRPHHDALNRGMPGHAMRPHHDALNHGMPGGRAMPHHNIAHQEMPGQMAMNMNHEHRHNAAVRHHGPLYYIILAATVLLTPYFSFIFTVVSVILNAILGALLKLCRSTIDYTGIMRIAALAITPPSFIGYLVAVIATVLGFGNILGAGSAGVFCIWLIVFVSYFVFGLLANKKSEA